MDNNEYREQLNKNGVIAFVPKGNSMWPTLKNAKQSVVLLPKKERLKKMDVAAYERDDGVIVLHRIIGLKDDGYVFCGDSLSQKEYVKEDAVFAVMQGFYRGKKYIETDSEEFKKETEELYKNDKKRIKRANRFFFRYGIRHKFIRLFTLFKRR